MGSSTSRWGAIALLACVLAAQVHFFVEASVFPQAPHDCQLCRTSACAVLEPPPSLTFLPDSTPLADELTPPLAPMQSEASSSPCAPPQS